MGLVKTIYNVLGGFYMNYNSTFLTISLHKLYKSFQLFLCIFSPSNFSFSQKYKNMHEKTEFLGSVFVFAYFRKDFLIIPQTMLQIPLWKFFLFPKEVVHNFLIHHVFLKSALLLLYMHHQ